MSVLIGSARMNEFGVYEGGQDGDQTGVEVSTQDWYLHELGWYVIRAKSPEMRKKIAQDMRWACANDNIGYDEEVLTDEEFGLLMEVLGL